MSRPPLNLWLSKLVEEEIDPEAHVELARLLRDDAEARRRYHEYMELHAMLRWGHARPAVSLTPSTAETRSVRSVARCSLHWRWAGAAAALLVAALTLWWWAPNASSPPMLVLDRATEGVWLEREGERRPAVKGMALRHGDIVQTVDGATARVRYTGEATTVALQVDTAARFWQRPGSGKRIELLRGDVACDVDRQPAGRPMVLRTRDAEAVVLGTRFVLSAGPVRTRLEVTEGAVRLDGLVSQKTVQTQAGWFAVVGPQQPLVKRRIADVILADGPIAYWRLNLPDGATEVVNLVQPGSLTGRVHKVEFNRPGPSPTEFPDFEPENTSADFDGHNDYIVIRDPGDDSVFDFENGDAITLEAWINPRSIRDDTQVYIVGKGRTKNKGFPAENHNWGLRIRGEEDLCKLSFIFRDRDNRPKSSPGYRQDWHRWVSREGFAPNTGWHHVAVTYRFGDPDSLRGYIDGRPVDGFWDYGGKTSQPPVVDNDEVWIGSALGGQGSSTFDGLIDEVAIYRKTLSFEQVRNHYRRSP
ncbi:MAG: LamG-like jellyroll fold domain-containing protein [Phycisphaeraceae bacterium]|nr:LamG-like jellyroll fold domain-containing protein [Phycisphaeraceae bacterium]